MDRFLKENRKPDLTSLVYGKVPPQALEMEAAVLGAMLLEKNCIDSVFEIIKSPDCFYLDAHQKIFSAIKEMSVEGQSIDLLTAIEYLRKSNELEIVGGAYFLMQLAQNVVSSAHAEDHSKIIVEKYMLREGIRVSGQFISKAYEDSADTFELLNKGALDMDDILSRAVKTGVKGIREGIREVTEIMHLSAQKHSNITGITSGYDSLDAKTNGWQNADLIILGARPSVGKTAFCLNLAYNCATAKENGGSVLFFSLEMPLVKITRRLISIASDIELNKIQKANTLMPYEITILEEAKVKLCNLKIFIDDTPGLDIIELRHKARKKKREESIVLIIIDYLQLMSITLEKGRSREQEISKISRDLKRLAKELNIPIIALSQLNRAIESKGEGAVPRLSDLRESGAIEQDADEVMFLSRINKDKNTVDDILLNREKSRDGETGDLDFVFEKAFQKFREKNWVQQTPTISDNPRAGITNINYRNESNEKKEPF